MQGADGDLDDDLVPWQDYSQASPFERFAAEVDAALEEWGLADRALLPAAGAFPLWRLLTFHSEPYELSVHRRSGGAAPWRQDKPATGEEAGENPSAGHDANAGSTRPTLSPVLESIAQTEGWAAMRRWRATRRAMESRGLYAVDGARTLDDAAREAHAQAIHSFFGVSEFVLLTPEKFQSDLFGAMSRSAASRLLSAVSVALAESRCALPAFVPVYEPSRRSYVGVAGAPRGHGGTRLHFETDVSHRVPRTMRYATALANHFSSQLEHRGATQPLPAAAIDRGTPEGVGTVQPSGAAASPDRGPGSSADGPQRGSQRGDAPDGAEAGTELHCSLQWERPTALLRRPAASASRCMAARLEAVARRAPEVGRAWRIASMGPARSASRAWCDCRMALWPLREVALRAEWRGLDAAAVEDTPSSTSLHPATAHRWELGALWHATGEGVLGGDADAAEATLERAPLAWLVASLHMLCAGAASHHAAHSEEALRLLSRRPTARSESEGEGDDWAGRGGGGPTLAAAERALRASGHATPSGLPPPSGEAAPEGAHGIVSPLESVLEASGGVAVTAWQVGQALSGGRRQGRGQGEHLAAPGSAAASQHTGTGPLGAESARAAPGARVAAAVGARLAAWSAAGERGGGAQPAAQGMGSSEEGADDEDEDEEDGRRSRRTAVLAEVFAPSAPDAGGAESGSLPRAAPAGSLAARLGTALAACASLAEGCVLWAMFVDECRRRWERAEMLPACGDGRGVNPAAGNTCLLHQKLLLLNACIARRRRARADMAPAPNDCAEGVEEKEEEAVGGGDGWADAELEGLDDAVPSHGKVDAAPEAGTQPAEDVGGSASSEDEDGDGDDAFVDATDGSEERRGPLVRAATAAASSPAAPAAGSSLRLLVTEAPIRAPATQDPGPQTEDEVEELARRIAAAGASGDAPPHRHRLFEDGLRSDMEVSCVAAVALTPLAPARLRTLHCGSLRHRAQAFKAANPGCVLEDFVRWHSPRDWSAGPFPGQGEEEGGDHGARGYLSPRMRDPRGLWARLWSRCRAVPAERQPPLFDAGTAALRALQWMREVSAPALFAQLVPTVTAVVRDAVHAWTAGGESDHGAVRWWEQRASPSSGSWKTLSRLLAEVRPRAAPSPQLCSILTTVHPAAQLDRAELSSAFWDAALTTVCALEVDSLRVQAMRAVFEEGEEEYDDSGEMEEGQASRGAIVMLAVRDTVAQLVATSQATHVRHRDAAGDRDVRAALAWGLGYGDLLGEPACSEFVFWVRARTAREGRAR